MNIFNRRQILLAGTASLLAAKSFGVLAASTDKVLSAAPSEAMFYEDGAKTVVWTYNGTFPGPELRVRRGDRIKILFRNQLSQPSSIHWHGIRIDNAMDGVSGLTQDPVMPGETFSYKFNVPDAGTYWYHPHNRSWEQLARGLYGPLIVEEDTPYPVDRDQVLVIDDWRLTKDGLFDEASLGNRHDWSHAGRLGNWATVNGRSAPAYTFQTGDRVRFRLINTSNSRVMSLMLVGLSGTLIARDGQPLREPLALSEQEVLTLSPAQRVDVVVDMHTAGALAVPSNQGPISLAEFAVSGQLISSFTNTDILPLPSNEVAIPTLDAAQAVSLVMEGGARSWLSEGVFNGVKMDGRSLADKGQFWTFNGQAGRSEIPLFETERGRSVIITLVNDTAWPHVIHLHGHHFLEVPGSNRISRDAPLLDSILLEARQTKRIAFVADNPGKWMLHCHMLEHQVAGMGTWFNVA